MNRLVLIISLAAMFWRVTSDCDRSRPFINFDGPMGQTAIFPWLGVLNVYLYLDDKIETAITGLVLIHEYFAIAHADDIARIPDEVFLNNCSVMFISKSHVPWFCQPKTYYLHPEYTTTTFNAIALLELNLDISGHHNLMPICWIQDQNVPKSSDLFVTGYKDENLFLEKVIYKVHEKEKRECQQMYQLGGLTSPRREPVHYNCYYSKTMKRPCVWENGMILVSNANAYFSLIGIAVHGPGCSVPARFIELKHYHEWASRIIFAKTEEISRSPEVGELRDVPLHEFYIKNPLRNLRKQSQTYSYLDLYDANQYGQPLPKGQKLNATSTYLVKVYKFNKQLDVVNNACNGTRTAFYTDIMQVYYPPDMDISGNYTYRLDLSDTKEIPATCIKLNVTRDGEQLDESIFPNINLTYMEVLVMDLPDEPFDNTPLDFLYWPPKLKVNEDVSRIPYLYPKFLYDPAIGRRHVKSYTLYFTFPFTKRFELGISFYNTVNMSHHLLRRAENSPKNYLTEIGPPVTYARNTFQKVDSKINDVVNQTRKLNETNFHKQSKIVARSSFNFWKSEERSLEQLNDSEVWNYIKNSAVPRKLRQYSSDAAATIVFKEACIYKLLLTILMYNSFKLTHVSFSMAFEFY